MSEKIKSEMVNKYNDAWKLDLLEAKFLDCNARFPKTKKLLTARNNEKLWKKLPRTKEEALPVIDEMKEEFFKRKMHAAHKKLEREVIKVLNQETELAKKEKKDSADELKEKPKASKPMNKEEVSTFFESKDNLEVLLKSRLVKCLLTSIVNTKELKTSPPVYISEEFAKGITDKSTPINPSHFFITHCQNNKALNGFISNIWNNKAVKTTLKDIEWSFKVVRGNISRDEKQARRLETGKKPQQDDKDDEMLSDDDSDDDGDHDLRMDTEEAFDKFAVYDDLVGASDQDDEEKSDSDASVNYNEVTDEETNDSDASEASHDSFFQEETPKKLKNKEEVKHNLPQLASGYYSGGSDDEDDFDADNDEVVKEATKVRKNRRGQRARRLIWEKKYGREAAHVKKRNEKMAAERQQKQAEYEERCRRRELKAKLSEPTGSNVTPLGERKPIDNSGTVAANIKAPVAEQAMHPSWQAKKLAEEKQKNVKFTGKKITFD